MGRAGESVNIPSSYRQLRDDLLPPVVDDPFSSQLSLSALHKVKIILMTLTLFPVRALLVVLLSLLLWGLCLIGLRDQSEKELEKPLQGWRKHFLHPVVRLVYRGIFFCLGFHWVSTEGRPEPSKAPLLVAAPHTCMFDHLMLTVLPCTCTVDGELLRIPMIRDLSRFMRCIPIWPNSPPSVQRARLQIARRAKSPHQWTQTVVFPEIISTNGQCIISFSTDAFSPGVSVQPVCLTISNMKNGCISSVKSMCYALWLSMCQIHNKASIKFLPVITPDSVQLLHPTEFAEKARQYIGKKTKLPLTGHSPEDKLLMATAIELGLPAQSGCIEYEKVHAKVWFGLPKLRSIMRRFAAIPHQNKGHITKKEFAKYLGLPINMPVASLFMSFDVDRNNTIDFREYALAMAIYCGKGVETIAQGAFQLIAPKSRDYFLESHLKVALGQMMEVKDKHVTRVFSCMDSDNTGMVIYDDFQRFLDTKPEYVSLFKRCLLQVQPYAQLSI